MRFVIKVIEARGAGRQSQDVIIDRGSVTIGRGTNQAIQIADKHIALAHATLNVSRGRLSLKVSGGNTFTLGDEIHRSSEIRVGDCADLSGHELTFVEHADNDDFILELRLHHANISSLADRFTISLASLNIPQRQLSWLAFLVVILFTILIPSVGLFTDMGVLRKLPLPDDSFWQTGALHHTHAFLGDDCTACHKVPFVPARNVDCLGCHTSTTHHIANTLAVDYNHSNECSDCHREHNEDVSIIRSDQQVCTECHGDLERSGYANTGLRRVTDFLDDHPPFRVSMATLVDNAWQVQRYDAGDGLMERSNLKFSHALHLDPGGIDSPTGSVQLECESCHESEVGGFRMKTPTMQQHCAGCHELSFDADYPERVVPHGNPDDLMQLLKEYYAFQFLNGDINDQGVAYERTVRRPGRVGDQRLITELITRGEQIDELTEEAMGYVDVRIHEAATNLFEKQICTTCHEVSVDPLLETPWQVLPVRLTPDWLPKAHFSHKRHRNMACADCHDARASTFATEILMPEIGSCHTCHGGEDANDRLASTCISCHEFHLDHLDRMDVLIQSPDHTGLLQ